MTQRVTDEQFGQFGKRRRDLERRLLDGSVPFELAMDGLRAVIEHDQPRLVNLVGPFYPKGTIALSLEVDLSLSLADMIRRGKYANEDYALDEITEERFPINRDVPELQYSTNVMLVPRYREGITFKEQEATMATNRLRQFGVVETLAIGEQYPHLQLAYYVIGLGSTWTGPVGGLNSPVLWRDRGRRRLRLIWRDPEYRLDEFVLCVASSQAVA